MYRYIGVRNASLLSHYECFYLYIKAMSRARTHHIFSWSGAEEDTDGRGVEGGVHGADVTLSVLGAHTLSQGIESAVLHTAGQGRVLQGKGRVSTKCL